MARWDTASSRVDPFRKPLVIGSEGVATTEQR